MQAPARARWSHSRRVSGGRYSVWQRSNGMPRYFTRAEAEALLPRVEPLLREMQVLRAELAAHEERLAGPRVKAQGNGHSGPGAIALHHAEIAQLAERIMQPIADIHALRLN